MVNAAASIPIASPHDTPIGVRRLGAADPAGNRRKSRLGSEQRLC
jgi:hypothetical protein